MIELRALTSTADALRSAAALNSWKQDYDALICVYNEFRHAASLLPEDLVSQIDVYAKIDQSFHQGVQIIPVSSVPGSRLVLAPTGPLDRDYDDVRRYADTARKAVARAQKAGARRLALLVVFSNNSEQYASKYKEAAAVALLGALQELYEPLEYVEWKRSKQEDPQLVSRVGLLSVVDGNIVDTSLMVARIEAIEQGRVIGRDICGSDPERMAGPKVQTYLKEAFSGLKQLTVEFITDPVELKREYPLLAAVARASMSVERHRPVVIKVHYTSPEQSQVKENLFFVGKGITYDTGGADVKTGGHMRGMSRDKGGAAGVAGFMKTVALLQPKHLNVTAYLAFVRNSIGSESYVSDEIIVSRAGVRVLVGNTDAEGRMVMADLLAEAAVAAKQSQLSGIQSRLFTVATLTGHVIRAYGPYPACLDNGPASTMITSKTLCHAGNMFGEPWELSTLRREDYDMVKATSSREDVVQCNTAPSTMTSRGHQFPAAFMAVAAGVAEYGNQCKNVAQRLAYTHLDIAGAAEEDGPASGSLSKCTGAPIITLTAAFL